MIAKKDDYTFQFQTFWFLELELTNFSITPDTTPFKPDNKFNYQCLFRDLDDLIEIVDNYFQRANLFVFSLKVKDLKYYQYSSAENLQISESDFTNLKLQNRLSPKRISPSLITEINDRILDLEETISQYLSGNLGLPNPEIISNYVKNSLLRLEPHFPSTEPEDNWFIIEYSHEGEPLYFAQVSEELLKKYGLGNGSPDNGYVLGIFNDFTVRVVLYRLGANPLCCYRFEIYQPNCPEESLDQTPFDTPKSNLVEPASALESEPLEHSPFEPTATDQSSESESELEELGDEETSPVNFWDYWKSWLGW